MRVYSLPLDRNTTVALRMFRAAGARRVSIDHVLNHIVVVATR